MDYPKLILLISGKRKSGKDFLCEKLKDILEEKCTIIRISGPLKSHYAKEHNLNLTELMSNGIYKEKYRLDMINWSDEVREKDPGYFCKAACATVCSTQTSIWIISDIRRKTDIKWFTETYLDKVKTIRISADQDIRIQRGWVFQEGVDNVTSECDLDNWNCWDLQLMNNSPDEGEQNIEKILKFIKLNT
ncbi:unnamed protein product [Brassicogethes aeneus]|uniref:Phosphomevalonate kinase n=1 Tax=Brassicogethes aeneus TaxID=1431903 RepID=A0A9P0FF24_BRAAE|nr:unnamed protein product [Brassicogethes aeneus]